MPTSTYELIASVSPTTTAFSITGIPQTYTDLVLIVNARVTSAWDITAMQPNGIGSGYSSVYYEGNGNTIGTGTAEISFRMGYIPGTSQANQWSADIVNIFNYANPNVYKTVFSSNRYPNTQGLMQSFQIQFKAGLLSNTAAITSLTIGTANGGTFASGTVYSLYGIKKE
jgi:hypothetical protein